ncbi:MAG: recombination mediator RecR [Candidatus Ancillula sp.]|jgi:recombination protein RecR|nr:recombination mediator RecR [Candidatus Ancillula sp.]
MQKMYEEVIEQLVHQLEKLPGIGPKSAMRLAFFILESEGDYALELANIIKLAKKTIQFCDICGNISGRELCAICSNPNRLSNTICVVEEPKDLIAIEKTHEFLGTYHVLGGSLNPIEGIGPNELRIQSLLERLGNKKIEEVILANNPNIEGEATVSYLARLISPIGIKVSRIATGLPLGTDLEFADEVTLGQALALRREVK